MGLSLLPRTNSAAVGAGTGLGTPCTCRNVQLEVFEQVVQILRVGLREVGAVLIAEAVGRDRLSSVVGKRSSIHLTCTIAFPCV